MRLPCLPLQYQKKTTGQPTIGRVQRTAALADRDARERVAKRYRKEYLPERLGSHLLPRLSSICRAKDPPIFSDRDYEHVGHEPQRRENATRTGGVNESHAPRRTAIGCSQYSTSVTNSESDGVSELDIHERRRDRQWHNPPRRTSVGRTQHSSLVQLDPADNHTDRRRGKCHVVKEAGRADVNRLPVESAVGGL